MLAQRKPAEPNELRGFIEVRPVLDYGALEPGHAAIKAIRDAAAEIAPQYQATVRLTGPVPMADEEFATLKENAELNGVITLGIVLFILWLALRSKRLILAVFINLFVGLALTAALGLLMVGAFNLISVSFAVLFVGIGVDFGIQYAVRYRHERHELDDLDRRDPQRRQLRRRAADAGRRRDGGGLSVVPADRLPRHLRARPDRRLRHADRVRHQHHAAAGADPGAQPAGRAGAARLYRAGAGRRVHGAQPRADHRRHGGRWWSPALPLLYWLRFDFNPVNLRSPKVESVATYLELSRDPESNTNTDRRAGALAQGGRRDRRAARRSCRRSRAS